MHGNRLIAWAALAAMAATLGGCETARRYLDRSDVVAEPTACTPQRFDIYFAESQARLTEPARQAIGMTAARLADCDIRSVQVTGLASASGGADANRDLSERRAVVVAEALTAAGWPAPAFVVAAEGEAGAVAGNGVNEPMRRRTEVVVTAAPR